MARLPAQFLAMVLLLTLGGSCVAQSEPYFGVKAGAMDLDGPTDMGGNVGGFAGFPITDIQGLALEADGSLGIVKGELLNRDFRVHHIGGYVVWRSASLGGPDLRIKGKAGAAWSTIDFDGRGNPDEFDASFGIGLNFLEHWEAEFAFISDDLNFISLGYRF